jgi:coenzyme PQQ precursor peptide PqqA
MEIMVMAWKTPKIVEVALGAEINCYACAELPA